MDTYSRDHESEAEKLDRNWNELLQERFRAAGWGEVRPSYGSILVPLF